MTVVFSTSSPRASVALFRSDQLAFSAQREAPRAASGACLEMLGEALEAVGAALPEVRLFVADVGPGSFTGVKVGVVLAKTLAFAIGGEVAEISSFDLVAPNVPVAIPSRKGEWFLRRPGAKPERAAQIDPPAPLGYGLGFDSPIFPEAAAAEPLLVGLRRMKPELLTPHYLAEPSVSTPKRPYRAEPAT